jgi:hypothetical protein
MIPKTGSYPRIKSEDKLFGIMRALALGFGIVGAAHVGPWVGAGRRSVLARLVERGLVLLVDRLGVHFLLFLIHNDWVVIFRRLSESIARQRGKYDRSGNHSFHGKYPAFGGEWRLSQLRAGHQSDEIMAKLPTALAISRPELLTTPNPGRDRDMALLDKLGLRPSA